MATQLRFADRLFTGELLYRTSFSSLDDFWWEGAPDVTVRGGELIVRTTLERDDRAHFVSTVFLRRAFQDDVLVEFQARSLHEQSQRNFNLFLHASDPAGMDLYDTRTGRTGLYDEYHALNNYLFTCVPSEQKNADGSDKMRIRMRRNPGFILEQEAHSYACENDRWYTFQYLLLGGEVSLCIDRLPQETYTWHDPSPLSGGYLGFRTYMSHLAIRGLRAYGI